MSISRRKALTAIVTSALVPFFSGRVDASVQKKIHGPCPGSHPIHFLIPKNLSLDSFSKDKTFPKRLAQATLSYLEKHYSTSKMPIWGRTFPQVDLQQRIESITPQVLAACVKYKRIHPVDPVWITSQILVESYFHEFAISPALAAGICQFMPATARSYGMLLAGDATEHASQSYFNPEYALSMQEYFRLLHVKRRLKRKYRRFRNVEKQLRIALEASAKKKSHPYAEDLLSYLKSKETLNEKIKTARNNAIIFFKNNVRDRDIFNKKDMAFLHSFDQRATLSPPIDAMLDMTSRALRARKGNILAATAGYNSGLSLTRDKGPFEPYGRIPNIQETATYVSHILVNYHEIRELL